MSLTISAISSPKRAVVDPQPKRWSVAQFQRLIDQEFFRAERVELIRGVIRRVEPRPRQDPQWKWTRKEYYRLWKSGLIPDRHVQLIDGEIYLMLPQNPPHASAISLVQQTLTSIFGKGYTARVQLPLDLGLRSEPEPDVAMVRGGPRDFTQHHPKGAVLVVEVADATLAFDRKKKGLTYAQGGIADYWIVNLSDGCLEVYREPTRKGYKSRTVFEPDDVVIPLHLPSAKLKVSELIP